MKLALWILFLAHGWVYGLSVPRRNNLDENLSLVTSKRDVTSLHDAKRLDRKLTSPTDLTKRHVFIPSPDSFETRFPFGQSGLWIACDYGQGVANWLLQEVLEHISDNVFSRAEAAGGITRWVPDGVLVAPYQYTAIQGVLLSFRMAFVFYGPDDFTFERALEIIDLVSDACFRRGGSSTLRRFMIYEYRDDDSILRHIMGRFTERTTTITEGRRLNEVQNVTLVANSSTNIDLATLPQNNAVSNLTFPNGASITSLQLNSSMNNQSSLNANGLFGTDKKRRSSDTGSSAVNESISSFDPATFQNRFQLPGNYWIAMNYGGGGSVAPWLFKLVWGSLEQKCQLRRDTAHAQLMDPIPGGTISLISTQPLPFQGLALQFLWRISQSGMQTLTWAFVSDVLEILDLICLNHGLYELLSDFVIYDYDPFGVLRIAARGEFIEDTHPLGSLANDTSHLDLQNLSQPTIYSLSRVKEAGLNTSSITVNMQN